MYQYQPNPYQPQGNPEELRALVTGPMLPFLHLSPGNTPIQMTSMLDNYEPNATNFVIEELYKQIQENATSRKELRIALFNLVAVNSFNNPRFHQIADDVVVLTSYYFVCGHFKTLKEAANYAIEQWTKFHSCRLVKEFPNLSMVIDRRVFDAAHEYLVSCEPFEDVILKFRHNPDPYIKEALRKEKSKMQPQHYQQNTGYMPTQQPYNPMMQNGYQNQMQQPMYNGYPNQYQPTGNFHHNYGVTQPQQPVPAGYDQYGRLVDQWGNPIQQYQSMYNGYQPMRASASPQMMQPMQPMMNRPMNNPLNTGLFNQAQPMLVPQQTQPQHQPISRWNNPPSQQSSQTQPVQQNIPKINPSIFGNEQTKLTEITGGPNGISMTYVDQTTGEKMVKLGQPLKARQPVKEEDIVWPPGTIDGSDPNWIEKTGLTDKELEASKTEVIVTRDLKPLFEQGLVFKPTTTNPFILQPSIGHDVEYHVNAETGEIKSVLLEKEVEYDRHKVPGKFTEKEVDALIRARSLDPLLTDLMTPEERLKEIVPNLIHVDLRHEPLVTFDTSDLDLYMKNKLLKENQRRQEEGLDELDSLSVKQDNVKVIIGDEAKETKAIKEATQTFLNKVGTIGNLPELLRFMKEKRSVVSKPVFTYVNNLITQAINDRLKYTLQMRLSIDTFVDDGDELIDFINKEKGIGVYLILEEVMLSIKSLISAPSEDEIKDKLEQLKETYEDIESLPVYFIKEEKELIFININHQALVNFYDNSDRNSLIINETQYPIVYSVLDAVSGNSKIHNRVLVDKDGYKYGIQASEVGTTKTYVMYDLK